MQKRLLMVLGMVSGAFLIHCGQGAVNEMLGDGGPGDDGAMVTDSMAQTGGTCCTPPDPPPPVVIFDGTLTPTDEGTYCYGPEWSIAGFQDVILHMKTCPTIEMRLEYRLGAAGFVEAPGTATALTCSVTGGLLFHPRPADGTSIRIRFEKYGGGDGMPCGPRDTTLVGVRR